MVEEKCPQDFIEKYCKSCGIQRCDRTKEYLNGCPYYNAYMCKTQNNAMEEKTSIKLTGEAIKNNEMVVSIDEWILPEGYIFKDENGNIINATKIVLEKKKKEYPKTYKECAEIVKVEKRHTLAGEIIRNDNYKIELLISFQKLLICRDAYWKIAGEEMGLNRPWKPDYDSGVNKYGIICLNGVVQESNPTTNWERHLNKVLDFPTEEMRDAFKENFDPDIEICKELL